MTECESARGVRFELIVLHDAEDILHPEEMRWFNLYGERYEMVQ
jgi:adsorption protein B